jgi:DNA-binding transcriptional ArsR family regulator
MGADADIAAVCRVLGDSHRASFVLALLGGEELPAGELAARAGASSSLTSAHLSKLLKAGLIDVRRQGRQRYYRVASPQVATAIEGLMAIAPARPISSLRQAKQGEAIRAARTCYDHLAGRLGVAVTEALERGGALAQADSGWQLTPAGEEQFGCLGIDVSELRRHRRPLLRDCLDWTERRPHLGGSLGAALAGRMLERGWIERQPNSRAVTLTAAGRRGVKSKLAVELSDGR